jgi:ribosome maturation protein Sdo1
VNTQQLITIKKLQEKCEVKFNKDLHLAVSMRSFRAETLALFIKKLLDLEIEEARITLSRISQIIQLLYAEIYQKQNNG